MWVRAGMQIDVVFLKAMVPTVWSLRDDQPLLRARFFFDFQPSLVYFSSTGDARWARSPSDSSVISSEISLQCVQNMQIFGCDNDLVSAVDVDVDAGRGAVHDRHLGQILGIFYTIVFSTGYI